MKLDWNQFMGKTLNITLFENYGVVYGANEKEHPTFYEIVFKVGKLTAAYDDGLLIESSREQQAFNIFVPYNSIKCVEIF
ncbi:MAG: hypothetical protein HYS25_13275 [Ignavibacteriales bacterium]|nr:hypothetical protein [Ignavibacteriales bacterium]